MSIDLYLAAACYPNGHPFQRKVKLLLFIMEDDPRQAARRSNDMKDFMDKYEKQVEKRESLGRKSDWKHIEQSCKQCNLIHQSKNECIF